MPSQFAVIAKNNSNAKHSISVAYCVPSVDIFILIIGIGYHVNTAKQIKCKGNN